MTPEADKVTPGSAKWRRENLTPAETTRKRKALRLYSVIDELLKDRLSSAHGLTDGDSIQEDYVRMIEMPRNA